MSSWLKRAGLWLGTELIIDLFRCSSKFVNVMPLVKHHAVKKKKMVSMNLPSNFFVTQYLNSTLNYDFNSEMQTSINRKPSGFFYERLKPGDLLPVVSRS